MSGSRRRAAACARLRANDPRRAHARPACACAANPLRAEQRRFPRPHSFARTRPLRARARRRLTCPFARCAAPAQSACRASTARTPAQEPSPSGQHAAPAARARLHTNAAPSQSAPRLPRTHAALERSPSPQRAASAARARMRTVRPRRTARTQLPVHLRTDGAPRQSRRQRKRRVARWGARAVHGRRIRGRITPRRSAAPRSRRRCAAGSGLRA